MLIENRSTGTGTGSSSLLCIGELHVMGWNELGILCADQYGQAKSG